MIPLIVASVVVAGLGDRPAAILGADGKAGYLAKLEQKLDTPLITNFIATAIPDCPDLTYTAEDFAELQSRDFAPSGDAYATQLVKPAVMEHIHVAGCGKHLRLNVLALRLQSNPDDLKISVQMAGETVAGLILQRDTYTYVAMATTAARTLAGNKEPCNQATLVIDTQVTVPPTAGNPWRETWYTSLCSFKARIAVDFTPDARGGTSIGAHPIKPDE